MRVCSGIWARITSVVVALFIVTIIFSPSAVYSEEKDVVREEINRLRQKIDNLEKKFEKQEEVTTRQEEEMKSVKKNGICS